MYFGRYQYSSSIHSVRVRPRLAIPRFRPSPVAFAAVIQVDEIQKFDHQSVLGNCWATMSAASATNCDAVLAVLESVDAESSAILVDSIVKAPHATWCYAFFSGAASIFGREDAVEVTAGDINSLACLLDAIAVSDQPRMRCVPLLAAAGWTLDCIASLPLVSMLLVLVPAPTLCHRSQRPVDEAAGNPCMPQVQGLGWVPDSRGSDTGADIATSPAATSSCDIAEADAVDAHRVITAAGGQFKGPMAIASQLEWLRPKVLPRWATQIMVIPAAENRGEGSTSEGGGGFMDSACDNGRPGPERRNNSGAAVLSEFRAARPGQPGNAAAGPAAAQAQSGHQQPNEISGAGRLPKHIYQSSSFSASLARYVTLVDDVPARADAPLGFERVAVGGTFDRLHAGHELLLAATALVAKRFVFVGVTADALLANKSHKDLLQSYETRAREAMSYMQAVRPGLQIEAGPLSDPKAPTLAELDPDMEALVVSVETLPGAVAINAGRHARGFHPLSVITVPVIGIHGNPEVENTSGFPNKLSSSKLRELEARKKAVDSVQPASAQEYGYDEEC